MGGGGCGCLSDCCLVQICVLDAQKNRLIETVLLSTHNIFFVLTKVFVRPKHVNF